MKWPWPAFSNEFKEHARAFRLDMAASGSLFYCVSFTAGRVWRFPFDDELNILSPPACCHSSIELLAYYLKGGDIHPPLSFLLFHALQQLGLDESGLRLCSLAMTALSLVLFHSIALILVARRGDGDVPLATRLVAVILFGLTPLAVGQGDAIRWYPVFAMLVSLFAVFYLFGGNSTTRLLAAIPLGLLASTNYLAIFVFVPFVLYRYCLQRQFSTPFDLVFGFVVLLFASFGIVSAYSLFVTRLNGVTNEFSHNVVEALMTNVLGFFGGTALGISQAWIIVPVVIISAIAAFSEINRTRPADPTHLLLLMLAATAPMMLFGFAKPRSFLYLAPIVGVLLTLYLDRHVRQRQNSRVILLAALILAPSFSAAANIDFGTHPFKRNSAIPYQNIIDFIAINESGDTLIVSTDPVIAWLLGQQHNQNDRCVSLFLDDRRCLRSDLHFDTIIVIAGHSDRSADAAAMGTFDKTLQELTTGRQKVASVQIGVDKDAKLKSRLTGVSLEEYIVKVTLYK